MKIPLTAGDVSATVDVLHEAEGQLLWNLENKFLSEIGEEFMTEEKFQCLQKAVCEGKIVFFIAKQDGQAVGMCSVSRCFSTFVCADIGVFDDFFVEPKFRGKGMARKLAQAAQNWCRENDIVSLTVSCAPCDEEMYQSLGFNSRIGTMFAYLK